MLVVVVFDYVHQTWSGRHQVGGSGRRETELSVCLSACLLTVPLCCTLVSVNKAIKEDNHHHHHHLHWRQLLHCCVVATTVPTAQRAHRGWHIPFAGTGEKGKREDEVEKKKEKDILDNGCFQADIDTHREKVKVIAAAAAIPRPSTTTGNWCRCLWLIVSKSATTFPKIIKTAPSANILAHTVHRPRHNNSRYESEMTLGPTQLKE